MVRALASSAQSAFRYCRPFLDNAPAKDLVFLMERIVTADADPTAEGALQGSRALLDYCRTQGEETGVRDGQS